MKTFLLLDGYNLAFRSYYAVPELSRSDGAPTNALHGWVRTFWKLFDEHRPEAAYVFFDLGGSHRRLALHPDYKAQRSEAPESFRIQVPILKKLAASMGVPVIEQEGVEADDLLASAALRLAQNEMQILMVSADKDLAQVIGPGITQLLPPPTANPRLGWRRLDEAGVVEKYTVKPKQMIDYLALIGDSSDNIPGLAGVGPKTAAKWLGEYASLEGLLAKCRYIAPARFQLPLEREAERLRRNRELIRLETDLPVDLPESPRPDPESFFALLDAYEMRAHKQEALKRYGG